jgi:hypothetical protein
MGGLRRAKGSWRRSFIVAVTASIALVGVVTAPASAGIVPSRGNHLGSTATSRGSLTTGSGTTLVVPSSVIAPTPTSLRFTYTAATSLVSGVVDVAVPLGWTAPTTSNTSASTGTVAVVGSTITVTGVTLTSGQTLVVTFGLQAAKVTPPSTAGYNAFTVSMSPTSSGTVSPLAASPSVFVYTLAPVALFDNVTKVPLAMFNRVGITSPGIQVIPPSIVRGQPAFVSTVGGTKVPASFFWGAEWCPYCGATSWSLIVALSRFGHFNQLYEIVSSPDDYAANTPSLTFYMSTYTSTYLTFTGYEDEGPFQGQVLDAPPRPIQRLLNKYNQQGAYPFVDIGNLTFLSGSTFDPAALSHLTQSQIAYNLRAPNAVTRAIVASANLFSAGICAHDGEKPAVVCKSSGVIRADKALGLRHP